MPASANLHIIKFYKTQTENFTGSNLIFACYLFLYAAEKEHGGVCEETVKTQHFALSWHYFAIGKTAGRGNIITCLFDFCDILSYIVINKVMEDVNGQK